MRFVVYAYIYGVAAGAAKQGCLSVPAGHQGCPLATNLCILPYFLALSRTQARYPSARIASFADDTYCNGKPEVLYAAYAEKRRVCLGPAAPGEPPACEVRSNLRKVHATSPSGSIADIPRDLGAGIAWANGFQCVHTQHSHRHTHTQTLNNTHLTRDSDSRLFHFRVSGLNTLILQ